MTVLFKRRDMNSSQNFHFKQCRYRDPFQHLPEFSNILDTRVYELYRKVSRYCYVRGKSVQLGDLF